MTYVRADPRRTWCPAGSACRAPSAHRSHQVQRAGHDQRPAGRARQRLGLVERFAGPAGIARTSAPAPASRRQAAARASAGMARGPLTAVVTTRASRSAGAAAQPLQHPLHGLVGHDARTGASGAPARAAAAARRARRPGPRPRPRCGRHRGGPADPRARSSSRPGQRTVARPRRTAASSTGAMPAPSRRVERGQRHRRVGGLVAAQQADAQVGQPGRLDDQPIEVHGRHRQRRHLLQRHREARGPSPHRGQARAARAGHRPVAALDDGRLLVADRGPAVGPRRSMWSSSTFVMTATPPSHVLVASRRPPRPTSTTATSTARAANQAKAAAVSSSNSVGGAERRRDQVRGAEHLAKQLREVRRGDGLAADHDAFAVVDEMRLGRLAGAHTGGPEDRTDHGLDAALAVGPPDEGAARGGARDGPAPQERARSPQAQLDAEAAPCLELGDGRRGGVGRGHERQCRARSSS